MRIFALTSEFFVALYLLDTLCLNQGNLFCMTMTFIISLFLLLVSGIDARSTWFCIGLILIVIGLSNYHQEYFYAHRNFSSAADWLELDKDIPIHIQSWISSFIMGQKSAISVETKLDFKATGLFHILVISGAHITLLQRYFSLFVQGFFKILYVPKLISPWVWNRVRSALPCVILLIIFKYCQCVGFSPPIQRAYLLCVIHVIHQVLLPRMPKLPLLYLACATQIILFPADFISISTLLSWGSYILVYPSITNLKRNKFLSSLKTQLILNVILFICLNSWSWTGLILNLIVAPLSDCLILISSLLMIPDFHQIFLGQLCISFLNLFLDLIHKSAEVEYWVGSYIHSSILIFFTKSQVFRYIGAIYVCVQVLNTLRDLSITDHEYKVDLKVSKEINV